MSGWRLDRLDAVIDRAVSRRAIEHLQGAGFSAQSPKSRRSPAAAGQTPGPAAALAIQARSGYAPLAPAASRRTRPRALAAPAAVTAAVAHRCTTHVSSEPRGAPARAAHDSTLQPSWPSSRRLQPHLLVGPERMVPYRPRGQDVTSPAAGAPMPPLGQPNPDLSLISTLTLFSEQTRPLIFIGSPAGTAPPNGA